MRFRVMLASIMLTNFSMVACAPLSDSNQQGAGQFSLQQVEGDGFALDIFNNSPTFSQILAINASGQMIGLREVADEAGTMFSQEAFFIDKNEVSKIPLLPGFTNVEALGLSDSGVVVGYVSRPIGHADGSLRGMLWDSKTGQSTLIEPPPGYVSCAAQGVSSDGQRVVGYSSGANPARMRPCMWSWDSTGKQWKVELLDAPFEYNPYMMGSRIAISPDGKRMAACLTVAELPNNMFDSSLFAWDWRDGQWERRLVSDEQMYLYDMNDQGIIAGVITTDRGRFPCVVDADGKITLIDLLPGDETGEARGISADGTVVGFSDDASGPGGGPQAFVWRAGVTELLKLPADTVYSAAFGINDSGQIGGLLDFVLPQEAGTRKAEPAEVAEGAEETAEPDTKTLAFRWSPKGSPQSQSKP